MAKSAKLAYKPLFSIIVTMKNVDICWLIGSIQSVQRQLYTKWELLICAGSSASPETLDKLNEFAVRDPRVNLIVNGLDADSLRAVDAALMFARGEYTVSLDPGDQLRSNALYVIVNAMNQAPDTDIFYSREVSTKADDHFDARISGPDRSPGLLRTPICLDSCFLVVRRTLLQRSQGLNEEFSGIELHERMQRLSELTDHIKHVPKILRHRGAVLIGTDS